jgi:hypothetical protein
LVAEADEAVVKARSHLHQIEQTETALASEAAKAEAALPSLQAVVGAAIAELVTPYLRIPMMSLGYSEMISLAVPT